MTYGERLRVARKELKLSQQELGKKVGVTTMVISRIETSETGLKAELLTEVEHLGINIGWILTGEGPVLKRNKENFMVVPIVDVQAAAGNGVVNEQEIIVGSAEIGLEFRAYWGEDVVIIRVVGDSMEPTIPKNAWILVKKMQVLKSEGIFIFLHDNELRCKRIQKKGTGEIIVKSDNPLYEQEIYPKNFKNLGELILIGEVVGIMTRM